MIEETGVWPDDLLDAYIVMIPKTDGDATPSGQRPLNALPIVYLGCGPCQKWVDSWLPASVLSLGRGRSSVAAWYSTTLDIEHTSSGTDDEHVHALVADVIKSFNTVDKGHS